jgi:hypothetical protein
VIRVTAYPERDQQNVRCEFSQQTREPVQQRWRTSKVSTCIEDCIFGGCEAYGCLGVLPVEQLRMDTCRESAILCATYSGGCTPLHLKAVHAKEVCTAKNRHDGGGREEAQVQETSEREGCVIGMRR